MLKKILYQYSNINEINSLIKGLTFTANPTPIANQWCFNSSNEIHFNSASTSLFGGVRKEFHGLKIGDVIEIDVEMYSISGILPKIAIDGYTPSMPSLTSTTGFDYPTNKWKQFKVKYVVQSQCAYYDVGIGLFTLDIGEYKLRNLSMKISTNTTINNILNTVSYIDLPYSANFTDVNATFTSKICKDTNGNITLVVNAKKIDASSFLSGTSYMIGTLPSGYRPKIAIRFPVIGDTSAAPSSGVGAGWIYTDGNINIRPIVDMTNIGFIINLNV